MPRSATRDLPRRSPAVPTPPRPSRLRAPLVAGAVAALLTSAVTPVVVRSSVGLPAAATEAAARQEADGKAVYLKSCKQCHGALGEPTKTALRQYDKIPSFTDPAFFTTRSDASMVETVTKGKGQMKGFADKLSPAEIQAVVRYTHTLAKHAG